MKKKIVPKIRRENFVTVTFIVPIKFYEHIGHPLSLQQNYHFKTKDKAVEFYDSIRLHQNENKDIMAVYNDRVDSELINVKHVVRTQLNVK